MLTTEYTRTKGLRLTYRIRADDRGRYSVFLGDKEMMRGRDPLTAGCRSSERNKRKSTGAVEEAKVAIETCCEMSEF